MSLITVPQPLYAPAPFVAYGTNPGQCYSTPILLSEIEGTLDNTNLRTYTSQDYCGKMAAYQMCTDVNIRVVVLYENTTTPHPYVKYGELCYGFIGTTTQSQTYPTVLAENVDPVAGGCIDAACTGANVEGESFQYSKVVITSGTNYAAERNLRVQFPVVGGLLPKVAVARQSTDFRYRYDNEEGEIRLTLRTGDPLLVHTLSYNGFLGTERLVVQTGPTAYPKKLLHLRGSTWTTYDMSPQDTQRVIAVLTGDKIYFQAAGHDGRVHAKAKNTSLVISWKPSRIYPRSAYQGNSFGFGSPRQLLGLGFRGRHSYEPYRLYTSFPHIAVCDEPANPSGLFILRASASDRRVLVYNRMRGAPYDLQGAALPEGPISVATMGFEFYAFHPYFDGYGEMDLWYSGLSDVDTPISLGLSPDRLLYRLSGFRVESTTYDLDRNSLFEAGLGSSYDWTRPTDFLPYVYTAADGEVRSIASREPVIILDGKTFTRGQEDTGRSQTVWTV